MYKHSTLGRHVEALRRGDCNLPHQQQSLHLSCQLLLTNIHSRQFTTYLTLASDRQLSLTTLKQLKGAPFPINMAAPLMPGVRQECIVRCSPQPLSFAAH